MSIKNNEIKAIFKLYGNKSLLLSLIDIYIGKKNKNINIEKS